MKVVVSDLFPDSTIEALRDAGLECYYDHTLKGPDLKQLLGEEQPQVLLVRSTRLPADIISASSSLELIVRAGTGTDGIDMGEASKKGIFVTHCPGKSAIAVAELVFGLITGADRSIPENVMQLRKGVWDKGRHADGLYGKTLGIVGLGDIGVEVAKRGRAFGMRLVGCDPVVTRPQAEEMGVEYRQTMEEVVGEADVLTFHVPVVRQTKFMLTPAILSTLKPDAMLVNTSRWDIVAEEDMLAVLEAKPGLRYACDCYRLEPMEHTCEFRNRLAEHPRVYGTCHVSSYTKQAELAFNEEAVNIILQYATSKTVNPRNCTNRARKTPATHTLAIRVLNEPGILAAIVRLLATEGWQVLEIDSAVFREAKACRASLDFLPADVSRVEAVLGEVREVPGVLSADCFPKSEEEDDSES